MRIIQKKEVAETLNYETLIKAIRSAFEQGATTPPRSIYRLFEDSGSAAALAIMPAWQQGRLIVIKLLSIFPENSTTGEREVPNIQASILAMSAENGEPLALIDGTEVTRRRTAATSALASSFLSRNDATRLLMVGSGAQAEHQIKAHCSVRPIARVSIWARDFEKAGALAATTRPELPGVKIETCIDLAKAAADADIISCATASPTPLILGRWLKPGSFLDLVGAHTPQTREADTQAITLCSVYVDSLETALTEAGDLLIPLQQGVIQKGSIRGDLEQLCRGEVTGRSHAEEKTLFKSVGVAIEDLAAVNALLGARY